MIYVVGQPYIQGKTAWQERSEYNYRDGAHELRIFYKRPVQAEMAAIQSGQAQFALYPYLDVIFFCYKFGIMPWADCNYSIHLVPKGKLPPDPEKATERMLLSTFLVDADNGILRAVRVVSFSPQFTRALHAAIQQQQERAWPGKEYDQQINRIYNQYSSAEIATRLAIATCKGGE